MLSRERIAKIAAREKAATKGPWSAGRSDMQSFDGETGEPFKNVYVDDERGGKHHLTHEKLPFTLVVAHGGNSIADSQFIGEARQDIPDLLAHIGEQEAEMERLRVAERKFAEFADLVEELVKDAWQAAERGAAEPMKCGHPRACYVENPDSLSHLGATYREQIAKGMFNSYQVDSLRIWRICIACERESLAVEAMKEAAAVFAETHYQRNTPEASHVNCVAKIATGIRALSTTDLLARHDAAVRLEEAKSMDTLLDKLYLAGLRTNAFEWTRNFVKRRLADLELAAGGARGCWDWKQ